jgi:hypothetical protein
MEWSPKQMLEDKPKNDFFKGNLEWCGPSKFLYIHIFSWGGGGVGLVHYGFYEFSDSLLT